MPEVVWYEGHCCNKKRLQNFPEIFLFLIICEPGRSRDHQHPDTQNTVELKAVNVIKIMLSDIYTCN